MAFSYGDNQQLINVTDSGGNVYNVEYDEMGRVTTFLNPDGNRTLLTYNEDDLLSSIQNADGSSVHYAYDSEFQLVSFV